MIGSKKEIPLRFEEKSIRKEVRFGGDIRFEKDPDTGKDIFIQENYESVFAIPMMPIVGYGKSCSEYCASGMQRPLRIFTWHLLTGVIITRRWSRKIWQKMIVDVLYPNDNHYAGKELRLETAVFLYFQPVFRQ